MGFLISTERRLKIAIFVIAIALVGGLSGATIGALGEDGWAPPFAPSPSAERTDPERSTGSARTTGIGSSRTSRPTFTARPMAGAPSPGTTPSLSSPAPAPAACVSNEVLNFRSGPGTGYPAAFLLQPGEPLSILARNGDGSWVQIRARGGSVGWVASQYISCPSLDLEALPAGTIPPAPTPAPPTATAAPLAQSPTAGPEGSAGSGQAMAIRLEDTDWQGGYRRGDGPTTYGGRTATWIYGTSTPYSAMQAVFTVPDQPSGVATLTVEGMDSEDRARTLIGIRVNDVEVYNGPNPLPDDDLPLESGTWATYTWDFDAGLLRPGENVIVIRNLAEGQFSLPPFFMLDYAIVRYGDR